MNSKNSSTAAASSNGKISKLAPSKRALFLSTYRRHQEWSLPDSVIYYITKNPSTSKVYEKVIKSCKYFFVKNPILVVSSLSVESDEGQWRTYFGKRVVDVKDSSSKIWVTNEFDVADTDDNPNVQYFSSTILPKIYKSDIEKFSLSYQNILYDELILLSSKCIKIVFDGVTVKDDNDVVVTLERIIEALPKLKKIEYYLDGSDQNMITNNTIKEMMKIPHFLTLKYLNLVYTPESFNLDDFYSYIKNNKKTDLHLHFCENISDAYKQRLQSIVNEIVQTEEHEYQVPYIYFPYIEQASYHKLYDLHHG